MSVVNYWADLYKGQQKARLYSERYKDMLSTERQGLIRPHPFIGALQELICDECGKRYTHPVHEMGQKALV